DVRVAAHGHDAHLIGAIHGHADLGHAATLVDREVAHFGAANRHFEHGPLLRAGVVFEDLVIGPEIAPYIVLAVDMDVIGLHRRIRERDHRDLIGPRINAGQARAPRIADPQNVGILVRAHTTRAL